MPSAAYLCFGQKEKAADQSFLARYRQVWHQPEERDSCAIVIPYCNRGLPRFIRNTSGAVPLNTFQRHRAISGVDAD